MHDLLILRCIKQRRVQLNLSLRSMIYHLKIRPANTASSITSHKENLLMTEGSDVEGEIFMLVLNLGISSSYIFYFNSGG